MLLNKILFNDISKILIDNIIITINNIVIDKNFANKFVDECYKFVKY